MRSRRQGGATRLVLPLRTRRSTSKEFKNGIWVAVRNMPELVEEIASRIASELQQADG
jgi:hypothetical protein